MQADNKRIAKNTMINYANLLITAIIGIFSSRFVLQALGASDYGLYNVVGSVIGMYSFISGSLSTTTIRFMNFEMGKKNGNLNRMFNICNTLHIGLAIIIFIISETLGIWYINNLLNVAPGKIGDAMFVFQISIIVACIGIINTPYSSLYYIHENFLFPTILGLLFTILRLLFLIFLIHYDGNCLRLYAIMMSFTTFASFMIYHLLAYRNWFKIVKWKFVSSWKYYKPLLSFTNYNMLGTVALTARSSGSNLLINYFFGTVVNAAFGIATTVSSNLGSFMSSIDGAAAPQITKSISGDNNSRVQFLANSLGRWCILLAELIVFPFFLEIDFILKLWLKNPPVGSAILCRIMLLVLLFSATSAGLTDVINGSGKIKWFKINISVWFLMCLPLGYLCFKLGAPPYSLLLCFLLCDIIHRIIQLNLAKRILDFDINLYIKESYTRPLIVLALMILYSFIAYNIPIDTPFLHIVDFVIGLVFSISLFYGIGLKAYEKEKIKEFLKRKI